MTTIQRPHPPILQIGDHRLRQLAQPVQEVTHPDVQALIETLLATAHQANGVGIAAPQLGYGVQLLIVASRPNPRYPDAPLMEPTALINPRILAHSEEIVYGWEGCLSIPEQRGRIPRYQAVELEYLDRHGMLRRYVWQDFIARIFQHEYDHLQGILWVDRAEKADDVVSEADYQRL